jgi:hypothetical protein
MPFHDWWRRVDRGDAEQNDRARPDAGGRANTPSDLGRSQARDTTPAGAAVPQGPSPTRRDAARQTQHAACCQTQHPTQYPARRSQVARLISVREERGSERDLFAVKIGDFDTHSNLAAALEGGGQFSLPLPRTHRLFHHRAPHAMVRQRKTLVKMEGNCSEDRQRGWSAACRALTGGARRAAAPPDHARAPRPQSCWAPSTAGWPPSSTRWRGPGCGRRASPSSRSRPRLSINTTRNCSWGLRIVTVVNPYGNIARGQTTFLGGPTRTATPGLGLRADADLERPRHRPRLGREPDRHGRRGPWRGSLFPSRIAQPLAIPR